MKLIIGNKAYSSWSMRGWLACKQSGLHFEELTVPLFGEDWDDIRTSENFAPSGGKVPILWDGETVIWDSLAIIDWLADKTHRDRFWPKDETARGMARSMAAEMHSSYMALRKQCPMNTRKKYEGLQFSPEVVQDADRILRLWAEARARFGSGGPFLFGTFGAVDIMYAPVVSRFLTYGFQVPGFAQSYMQTILEHEWIETWMESAEDEPWVIERLETPETVKG
ncbi:glutathione S-transferase family protein [Parasphingorhabdus halotolerans]|uniref:Glutathione S-transferase family protein n=1 Tax=Parasphingorhabdus halotolerans TaxID=2725558 RepID=A0A6H2DPD6_9SPHN|nr:glutathione S-transferase family protein [Parasphingorhabdus halotolerans]QJB69825.1 glutathione S-transferase family protein [Parasphingorhabdus halotolerans]